MQSTCTTTREWPAWISCKTLAAWAPETNARLQPEAPRPVRLGEFPSACVETDQRHASVDVTYQRPPVSHQTQHIARGCVSDLARGGDSALPDAGGNGAFSLPHRWTAINLCAVPSPMHALACEFHRERLVACEWPLRHGGSKWLCSSASRCVGRCELSRAGELLLRTAARERASPAPRLLNFPRARTRQIQAARHNLGIDLGKFDRR